VPLASLLACNAVTTSESRSAPDAAQADASEAPSGEVSDAKPPPVDVTSRDATEPFDAALKDVSTAPQAASPYPPPTACDVDASAEASVTACPPPISVCADLRGIKYFDWGQCVAGWCEWPQMIMSCPSYGAGCFNGACLSGPTN
jgi:hypothetical protein